MTPTQARLLDVLADGEPHTVDELTAQLYDELGSCTNVRYHISQIRKVLHNEAILTIWGGYRLVGVLPPKVRDIGDRTADLVRRRTAAIEPLCSELADIKSYLTP